MQNCVNEHKVRHKSLTMAILASRSILLRARKPLDPFVLTYGFDKVRPLVAPNDINGKNWNGSPSVTNTRLA